MTLDPTINIGDILTIGGVTCGCSWTVFYLWFKNNTSKFVTYKEFNMLQESVIKIEGENKLYYQIINSKLSEMESTGKLKHEYLVKELEHINNNLKNSDRSSQALLKNSEAMVKVIEFFENHRK